MFIPYLTDLPTQFLRCNINEDLVQPISNKLLSIAAEIIHFSRLQQADHRNEVNNAAAYYEIISQYNIPAFEPETYGPFLDLFPRSQGYITYATFTPEINFITVVKNNVRVAYLYSDNRIYAAQTIQGNNISRVLLK